MTLPKVSVIVPARNAAGTIEATIDGIRAQDYTGEVEVVVAEGGSDDDTRAILDAQPDLRVVDNPPGTTPHALNAAIAAATGDVLVRCDAHAVLPPGYVSTAVRVLAETGADVVGGRQDAVGGTPFEEAVAAATNSWIAGGATFRTATTAQPAETVYLGVFPRATFETYGRFDEEMLRNQDYELNHRVRKGGGTVWFDPDLRVRYRPRGSLGALWTQYFRYGSGKRRMLRSHPDSVRPRQLAPVALVLGLVVTAALGPTLGWMPLGAVGAGYLAVLVAASTVGAGAPTRVRLGLVALTMHVAWASGFLFGRS